MAAVAMETFPSFPKSSGVFEISAFFAQTISSDPNICNTSQDCTGWTYVDVLILYDFGIRLQAAALF